MNFEKFEEMWRASPCGQWKEEWKLFLEFCEAYFRNRKILNPIVVELGTYKNTQRFYYKEFLGARHIGIDGSTYHSPPDILGTTHDPQTKEKLLKLLDGKEINLLFIDADHSYEAVKKDYEIYAPMTRNIIALHDIVTPWCGVKDFWRELLASKEYTKSLFYNWCPRINKDNYSVQYGIGIVIKE